MSARALPAGILAAVALVATARAGRDRASAAVAFRITR
jgi:hypothetical protein